jgi:hypothetical protein
MGNTPLHYFCESFPYKDFAEPLHLMIDLHHEMIDQQNEAGDTPLHKTICNTNHGLKIAEILIKLEANVNIQNAEGKK